MKYIHGIIDVKEAILSKHILLKVRRNRQLAKNNKSVKTLHSSFIFIFKLTMFYFHGYWLFRNNVCGNI